ncbi:MAG: A/G-specific adenine glycosylase [Saprospiraceae bacterium]|nr:A/G-specific adenine glycosylase [Saprospiraceae bacterium]
MITAKSFRSGLYSWAEQNPRTFPWTGEKDPYKIWISEILLQQTRSEQALSYYQSFLQVFPDIHSLSDSPLDTVLKYWQGLGYYSRAKNLHETAKELVKKYNGVFPKHPRELLALKGIGNYTSAAIASFAFKHPVSVMDGNVIRLFARLLGIPHLPERKDSKAEWDRWLEKYLDTEQSDIYNQALMNFGAVQCKPVNPQCEHCVFSKKCVAYLTQSIALFPAKKPKVKIKKRYFNFILFSNAQNEILIQQRNEKDIWRNLYQLPLLEKKTNQKLRSISLRASGIATEKIVLKLQFEECRQVKLSHQELHCNFYSAQDPPKRLKIKPGFSFVNRQNLANFAFPRVISQVLYSENNHNNHVKQSNFNRQSGKRS